MQVSILIENLIASKNDVSKNNNILLPWREKMETYYSKLNH